MEHGKVNLCMYVSLIASDRYSVWLTI